MDVVIIETTGETQMVTADSNGKYSVVVPAGPVVIDIVEGTLTVSTDPTTMVMLMYRSSSLIAMTGSRGP